MKARFSPIALPTLENDTTEVPLMGDDCILFVNNVGTAPASNIDDLQFDGSNNLKVAEQFASQAEDNTNGVIAVQIKPLTSSTYAPLVYSNFGAAITNQVKQSTGSVYSVFCENINAAKRYLQLHNSAVGISAGNVPLAAFAIPATSSLSLTQAFFTSAGMNFTTGITFAFSTTAGTYTAGVATDQNTIILYK